MRIILELPGTGRALMRPAQKILQACAEAYAEEFKSRPLVPLYDSHVCFRPEPWQGLGTEEWASPYDVYDRGWGDCDDLSLIRCGQLLATGENANIVEAWRVGSKSHHFFVRRYGPDGPFEDPSAILIKLGRRMK